MKKLWEINHPYYCSESNYFAPPGDCSMHYKSWNDFYEENGDADDDYNLIFRFDWEKDEEVSDKYDDNYRDSILKIFYLGQRKGIYRWVTVEVCNADEPIIREWLKGKWEHMKKLWEPFSQ